jgi:hypothetical protein
MPDNMNVQEVAMLREELEMLMAERGRLLQVVGAAAVLVANTNARELPTAAAEAADLLSRSMNDLPEESLKDALDAVHALIAS